jgi:antitoxin component YwqK of YwqJK toxin-antitoxin module
MKYIYVLFFSITISAINAQVVKPEKTFKVPLKTAEEKIEIEVDNTDKKITTKSDKTYYWFKSKAVHITEGNYSGRLLHGEYISYFKSNQLKTKGSFVYGLKSGEWVDWDENGKKVSTTYWKSGLQKEETKKETENPEPEVEKEKTEEEKPEVVKQANIKKVKKDRVKKEKKEEKIETDKSEIKS